MNAAEFENVLKDRTDDASKVVMEQIVPLIRISQENAILVNKKEFMICVTELVSKYGELIVSNVAYAWAEKNQWKFSSIKEVQVNCGVFSNEITFVPLSYQFSYQEMH